MDRLVRSLSSFRTTLSLLAAYMVALAAATFVEKHFGSAVAREYFYHSPVLLCIQLLMIANFFLYASEHNYLSNKRLGMMLTHIAFIVILAGAVTTHLLGVEGIIHLREGESTSTMLVQSESGQTIGRNLPFTVSLDDFVLERYPGSGSPSSYESFVRIDTGKDEYTAHIFMNNVLDVESYRLYQASFDPDEKGSVLSVNYDALGRSVTYSGYTLLLVGLLLSFIGRNGRFRSLLRRLKSLKASQSALALCLLCGGLSLNAADWRTVGRYQVDKEHADRFGELPMQGEDGRMMPVNTFSSEILRKLYKEESIGGLSPDQFLLGVMLMPDLWAGLPCIAVTDKNLSERFDIDMPYSSYSQMFDAYGNYKLQGELERIYRIDPALRNESEKNILKQDELVNIFNLLMDGSLLRLFPLPDDETHRWYAPGEDISAFNGKDSLFVARVFDWYLEEASAAISSNEWSAADKVIGMISTYQQAKAEGVDVSPRKMKAELRYNRLNVFRSCKMGYILIGVLSLVWAVISLAGKGRPGRLAGLLLVTSVAAVFAFHTFGMGLRWYIGGHAPWSNSYETMVYIAWATVLAGLLFAKRDFMVFSLAVLFGGVILFVSGLSWMDPQITPLVPVLKSPWLMFHVAVIVAAYGFFGLSALVGISNMLLMCAHPQAYKRRITELGIINEMSLWVGLALMTTGTFLGAVWADVSWGRYWAWDPKETWALITVLVYSVVTHIHLLKSNMSDWLFNFLSVLAFASVLMTYFGVNLFLSGMHSYAHNGSDAGILLWIALAFGLVCVLGHLSRRSIKRHSPVQ